MRASAIRALSALLLVGFPARSEGAWPSGAFDSVPIAVAPGVQWLPSGVPDGHGGCFLVWTDGRDSLVSGTDVYAQHVNALGEATWQGNGAVVSNRVGIQRLGGGNRSALVPDGSGGVIVVFTTDGDNFIPLPWISYVQRLDANGVPQWGDSGIALTPRYVTNHSPVVRADGAGGAFVAWFELELGTIAREIRAQHFDPDGNPLWATDGVVVCDAAPDGPQMVLDGSGGLILCWQDFRSDPGGDLYAQRLDAAGVPQWTDNGVPIFVAPGGQGSPRMASDPGGGALIAWATVNGEIPAQVRAQKVSFDGVPQWAAGGVTMNDRPGDAVSNYIASDGLGGAFIAFGKQWPGPGFDAWAQRILANGSRAWGDGILLAGGADIQSAVGIVSDGAGGMIADWIDQGSGFYDIYAQRLDGQGVKQWGANGSAVKLAPGAQHLATIVQDDKGGAFIAWTDKSVDAGDVRAQYVQSDGTVGGAVLAVPPATSAVGARVAFTRNPVRGDVRIRFHRDRAEPGMLELYDLAGRTLTRHSIDGFPVGDHELTVAPAGALPPGLYFARLRTGDRVDVVRGVVSR